MKVIALGVVGLVPLAAQAAVVTLVNNIGEGTTPATSTMTDGFAVPIGTNGAETTYLLNQPLTTTITTTVNGGASTTTQTTSASHTLIVSASGYKLNGVEGIAGKMDLECRSTGKDVGECLIAGGTGTEAQTATVSVPWPPNDALVVPVSATGGAVGLSTGKHLMLTVGALVLGALAIF